MSAAAAVASGQWCFPDGRAQAGLGMGHELKETGMEPGIGMATLGSGGGEGEEEDDGASLEQTAVVSMLTYVDMGTVFQKALFHTERLCPPGVPSGRALFPGRGVSYAGEHDSLSTPDPDGGSHW